MYFQGSKLKEKKFEDFGIPCERTEFELDFFKCYVIRHDFRSRIPIFCLRKPFIERFRIEIIYGYSCKEKIDLNRPMNLRENDSGKAHFSNSVLFSLKANNSCKGKAK